MAGTDYDEPPAVMTPPLAPATLSMEFGANDGPLAGREGTEVTPSKIRNRLIAETGKLGTGGVLWSERSIAFSINMFLPCLTYCSYSFLASRVRRHRQ